MTYKVNGKGVSNGHALIRSGKINEGAWSFSAADGNKLLGKDGDDWGEYARWFLAVDPGAEKDTKERFHFPFGKSGSIFRRGVIAAKSRAAQNGYDAIEKSADELLSAIDKKIGKDKDDKKESISMIDKLAATAKGREYDDEDEDDGEDKKARRMSKEDDDGDKEEKHADDEDMSKKKGRGSKIPVMKDRDKEDDDDGDEKEKKAARDDEKEAVKRRIQAITACQEAKGREALAQHLAFNTEMSVKDAVYTLTTASKSEPKPAAKVARTEEDAIPGFDTRDPVSMLDDDSRRYNLGWETAVRLLGKSDLAGKASKYVNQSRSIV